MPHSTDNQHIFYIDPSAVSGSTNHLRDELGLTWISGEEAISSVSASTQLIMSYEDMSQWDPPTATNGSVLELSAPTWLDEITSISEGLRYVELQPVYQTTASVDKITPNYVIPGRFYGAAGVLSPDGDSVGGTINNDVEWKAYLLGGTVGTKTYPGIYSETEFSDFGFEYTLPYSADEGLTLGLDENPATITYSYNLSLPEVEKRYANKSELELPLIELLKEGDDGGSANSAVKKFLTLETLYADTDGLNSLLSPKEVDYFPLVSVTPLPINEPKYQDLTKNLVEYLITGSQMELSASTIDAALPKLKNLLYGAASADRLQNDQAGNDGDGVLEHYPSFVTVTFPTNLNEDDEETNMRSVFEAYDDTEGLLRIIKENFGEPGNVGVQQFVTQNKHGDFGFGNQTISSTTLKTGDFIEMLVNDYNAQSTSNDFYVVGGSSAYAGAQNLLSSEARNGSRFLKSRATLGVLSKFAGFLAGGDTIDGSPIVDLDVELTGMPGKNGIYAILEKGGVSNYHETVAYRIEKRRGDNDHLLQNIWIYNSRANEIIGAPVKFKDSQVKYAENYKYTIYAYVLVGGMTYKMGDLVIGRTIGTAADTTGTQFGATGSHCIQFYDPATDATTEQLFSLLATSSAETWTAGNGSDQYHGALNYIGAATAGSSQFATNAQTISPYPFII